MDDAKGSSSLDAGASRHWLLLMHQLPPKPDYLRVKVRRRLQRLGAVPIKSAIYALPTTDEALEDFRWLRREILADGGEAVVCEAALVDGLTDADVEALFRADRDRRYAALAEEARERQASGRSERSDLTRRLRRRLQEVVAMDYFDASGRAAAEHAIRALEPQPDADAVDAIRRSDAPPRGATWVTRRGVRVDRMASGWLIRRFIDPDARFEFVQPEGYSAPPDVLRFDMFDGEFTHEGDHCTLETLIARFAIDAPGLRELAQVVHDIDCKDGKFRRPETAGVAALVQGIAESCESDDVRMERGALLFDSLFESFRRAHG